MYHYADYSDIARIRRQIRMVKIKKITSFILISLIAISLASFPTSSIGDNNLFPLEIIKHTFSAVDYYAAAIDQKGDAYLWEHYTAPNAKPIKISDNVASIDSTIIDYYADLYLFLLLKNDGTVWQCSNHCTQPIKVEGLENIVSVCATPLTNYALKSDGTVWKWDSLNPQRIEGIEKVIKISNSVFLKSDGTVWVYSNDNLNKLDISGIIDITSRRSNTSAYPIIKITALKKFDSYENSETQNKVPGLSVYYNMVSMSDGGNFFIDKNGEVFFMGNIELCEFSINTQTLTKINGVSEIISVESNNNNFYSIYYILAENTYYTFSDNFYHPLFMKKDGTILVHNGDTSISRINGNLNIFIDPIPLKDINGNIFKAMLPTPNNF